jgi:hypothetical protein
MTFETVISPVLDEKINSHISESPVWKSAFKREELNDRIRGMHPSWYEYTIQFSGTRPIMMTKMKQL